MTLGAFSRNYKNVKEGRQLILIFDDPPGLIVALEFRVLLCEGEEVEAQRTPNRHRIVMNH
jgi:hypothetical protein